MPASCIGSDMDLQLLCRDWPRIKVNRLRLAVPLRISLQWKGTETPQEIGATVGTARYEIGE
jgi:hypothetical protein